MLIRAQLVLFGVMFVLVGWLVGATIYEQWPPPNPTQAVAMALIGMTIPSWVACALVAFWAAIKGTYHFDCTSQAVHNASTGRRDRGEP